jgi:hypothetical protein
VLLGVPDRFAIRSILTLPGPTWHRTSSTAAGGGRGKHGILERYFPVCVGKTGSRSPGRRVAYLDGFAGPGMHQDGTPGSPELALRTAIKLRRGT